MRRRYVCGISYREGVKERRKYVCSESAIDNYCTVVLYWTRVHDELLALAMDWTEYEIRPLRRR